MYDCERLALLFERPAMTSAIIGAPITVKLDAQACKALATIIRAMGGQASDGLSKSQISDAMHLILAHTSLFTLIRLWALMRLRHWANN